MIKGITIDPSHALDLDDAIWVDSLPGGGWRAQVSIANVARAVRPGSPEDLDARARVATRASRGESVAEYAISKHPSPQEP
jgi:exoribonuclease R